MLQQNLPPQLVHVAHIVKCFIVTVGMQSEPKELEAFLAVTDLVKIAYQNRISFLKSQSQ